MSTLLIGKLPPPLGGVTVYVKRKLEALNKANVETHILEVRKDVKSILTLLFFDFAKYETIYVNSLSLPFLIILLFKGAIKRSYLVDHNHSRNFQNATEFKLAIYRYIFVKCKKVLLVSPHLKEHYKCFRLPEKCLGEESVFIPPNESDEIEISNSYPLEVNQFLQESNSVFLISAWKPTFVDGKDLYGVLQSIEALNILVNNRKKEVSILCFIGLSDSNYLSSIYEKLSKYKLNDNFLLVVGQYQIWPLFKKVQCFLRPTLTDGDSVSLREALYFGCNTIASSVVPRPEGVREFPINNLSAFVDEIEALII